MSKDMKRCRHSWDIMAPGLEWCMNCGVLRATEYDGYESGRGHKRYVQYHIPKERRINNIGKRLEVHYDKSYQGPIGV